MIRVDSAEGATRADLGSPQRRTAGGEPRIASEQVKAFVVWLVITIVAGFFVFGYSIAMGDPKPVKVPIGVVGIEAQTVDAAILENGTPALSARSFDNLEAAKLAVTNQTEYGVVFVSGDSGRLFISTASGPSVARTLEALAPTLAQKIGVVSLPVTDLNPISARDPNGTVFFYMTLAAVILGFVGQIQSTINAKKLRWSAEMGWTVARAVSVGFVITLAAGPILQMENPPFFLGWLVLSLTSFVAGTMYATFRLLVGKTWAMLPTWVLFVLIGSPSSGGAVADPLLPTFFAVIGPYMPAGACVQLLRDLTYFPGHVGSTGVLALTAWAIVGVASWLLLHLRKAGWGPEPD